MLDLIDKKEILIEYGFENDLSNMDNYFISEDKQLFTPKLENGWISKTGKQVYDEWLELQKNSPSVQPNIEEINTDKITVLIENQKQQDNLLIDNTYRITMLELNTNNML
ncbi:hypothetical protein [Clostridioides sp. ES-S-0190-01]|uniref:hypothetical protein n=1 Tax=Clostridioides sp. ES-S-0190-01 TaxID=2770787 RepID=UPI001D1003DD|nr:hypothetical protein [Clostridioides sp. ES-S-0190-01]